MRLFITFVLICLPVQAVPDVPDAQKPEVDYLIEVLASSDCEMIRNGKTYSGAEGANHVRRKYDHYRNEISSTEQFIELSATKSTMSGKDYLVRCPGEEPVRSQEWLLEQLQVFREEREARGQSKGTG